MWKWVIGCAIVWGVCQVAFADDVVTPATTAPPAILNDPPGFVSKSQEVVRRLDPSYETLFLISDGTWAQGVSAALLQFESRDIPIASLRLGFATNENLYGGVSLDLPGLTKRWVPATVKGFATVGPLDTIWALVGKYARVGVIGGYTWSEEKPIYGLTAGAALSF